MTEGQEEMSNIEAGKSAEKPISEYTFRETFSTRQRLTRQRETVSGDAQAEIDHRLVEVAKRERHLFEDVEQEGGLLGLDQEISVLRDMLDAGQLSPSDIHDALRIAPQLDSLAGIDPRDPHAFVREWYYRKNLDEITGGLREQKRQPTQEKERRTSSQQPADETGRHHFPPGQEEPSHPSVEKRTGEMETRNNAAIQELITEIKEGRSLSPEAIQRLRQTPRLPDYETGGAGIPGLPDVREIGEKELKKLFRERLKNLIEEQADQSFDQNWRLVYPLEMTIMSLYPKRGELETIPDPVREINEEGKEVEVRVNLSSLRKELSTELQAYRNIHNYIYVHKRVGGVAPLIEAGALLSRDTIETLFHIPEVAKALRKFEEIGNECCHAKQEAYKMLKARKKGEDPSSEEKEWSKKASKKEAEAKSFMSNSDNKEGGPFWARRIAGGLYSGLHESARHDMQVNESGDFFTDRLFHASERAAIQWNNWGRNPRPQLFETLNLKVDGFFETILWEKFKENKNGFKTFCDNMGISCTFRIDKNGEKDGFSSLDLSKTNFEGMDFSNEESDSYLQVKSDEVRLANLTLDDADKIRKAIFDPKGFLDDPSMATLKRAYEVFKHLKGKKRSDWLEGVCEQVILIYRDTVHPQNERAPARSRKCPGQEIYPEMTPWTNNEVKNQLDRMTPPLTKPDADILLEKFVGTREQIRRKEDISSAAKVGGSILGEFVKSLLGLK